MSRVALAACRDYAAPGLEAALRRAVGLVGGMAAVVPPGARVLLKPNLLGAHRVEERVTTDPAVVRVVAEMVREAGGEPFIADSPALDRFPRVAARTGMAGLARELGMELVELGDPVVVRPPQPAEFRRLEIARAALEAEVVINLPKLKTHSQMLLTLGVKNCFGTVVAQRKAAWHYMVGLEREPFASLLLDIYRSVAPALTILDGVWGMEGRGPAGGRPRRVGLVAASRDALALDLAVAGLLGVPPRRFPLHRAARRRGLLPQVELCGDPAGELRVEGFLLPELDSLDLVPRAFRGFLQRRLVSRPVQDPRACLGCGKCVEVCPARALAPEGPRLRFDYRRCIRCYCCQEVCPARAIGFRSGLLVRLLRRLGR